MHNSSDADLKKNHLTYPPLLKKSKLKHCLFILGCVLSFGTLNLIFYWFPKLFTNLYDDSDIESATHVFIHNDRAHLCQILKLQRQSLQIHPLAPSKPEIYFEYKRHKFHLHNGCFHLIKNLIFEQTSLSSAQLGKYSKGLSDCQAQALQRSWGPNVIEVHLIPIARLFLEQLITPFTIFQFFSFYVWFNNDYAGYATVILVITLLSMCVSVYESRKQNQRIRQMSFYKAQVQVKRRLDRDSNSHVIRRICSSRLQMGDIMYIPRGQPIPADLLLVSGKCVVDESLINGEATPCAKQKCSAGDALSKNNVLKCGTHCLVSRGEILGNSDPISGSRKIVEDDLAVGLVLRTGFYTVKGELIRDILFQESVQFKFNRDSFKFLGVMLVIVTIGFCWNVIFLLYFSKYEFSLSNVMIRSLDLFTTAIPPSLPLSLIIGVEFASARLARKRIFCLHSASINAAGRVKLFCFDKTGTLTSSRLKMHSVLVTTGSDFDDFELNDKGLFEKSEHLGTGADANNSSFADSSDKLIFMEGDSNEKIDAYSSEREFDQIRMKIRRNRIAKSMLEAMGTCHSLESFQGHFIGDPLELLMFSHSGYRMDEFADPVSFSPSPELLKLLGADHGVKLTILRTLHFSPQRKRMSVICKKSHKAFENSNSRSNINDSAEQIFTNKATNNSEELVMYTKGAPEIILALCKSPSVAQHATEILISKSKLGFRVLAVAKKNIKAADLAMSRESDALETDLEFVGFLLFGNPLKPNTTSTIRRLRASGIGNVMITGDNLLTGLSVSDSCGISDLDKDLYTICWDNSSGSLDIKLIRSASRPISCEPKTPHFEHFEEYRLIRQYHKILAESEPNTSSFALKTDQASKYVEMTPNVMDEATQALKPQTPAQPVHSHSMSTLTSLLHKKPDIIFGMTGDTFDSLSAQNLLLPELLLKTRVFARSKPDQKARVVSEFQRLLATCRSTDFVGFCGDGANDCLALKTANVGLSLTQTEASIAAPFNTTIGDVSAVTELVLQGKCCLQVAVENFEFVIFTSLTQFVGILVLYWFQTDFSNGHYYFLDLGFTFVFIFFISRAKPARTLSPEYPPGDLLNFPVMLRLLGALGIFLCFTLLAVFMLTRQGFFVSVEDSLDAPGFGSIDLFLVQNNLLFYIIAWAYVASVFVFVKGRPFKRPLYHNSLIIGCLCLNALFLIPFFFYNDVDVSRLETGGIVNLLLYCFLFVMNNFVRVMSLDWPVKIFSTLSGFAVFCLLLVFDKIFVDLCIHVFTRLKSKRQNE